ncbi:hypothetical protein DBR39_19035 [Chryseobacterium sp. KBW03]|jgi:hypothetical protein|uniref:hypothetical protein n=1 Tax=unclassified Chryseobacterium TaxID=2593645 RepID=UPI000F5999D2|nr:MULTISPECIES: hypothetical protein [unclassified Chryseobacterium]RQO35061.1 hypothetical protein DBR39_19035 [Chryseobacterium sp. KBW03]UKB80045.1 hypothetical protein LF886_03305 [Chryseobacterium sp. MEBOG07]
MAEFKFSEEAISHALEAAKRSHEDSQANRRSSGADSDLSLANTSAGYLLVTAECISITVENNKVCINLPLGFGKYCFSIPLSIPNGTAGQACLSICTTWGIPTGIRVTIIIAGITIISQSFGKC